MGCGLWMINDGVAWSQNHALKQAALFDAFLTDAYSNSLGLTLSEAILATSYYFELTHFEYYSSTSKYY
jgi:hypothetical protein